MTKQYRFAIQFLALLFIILPAIVLPRHFRDDLSSDEKRKELLSRENHYVQYIFCAARNCDSYELCEQKVNELMQDSVCPKDVLKDAHVLSMAMGNEQANRRVVRMIEKKERPWTHDGRTSQAKLFLLSVGALAGMTVGVLYANDITSFASTVYGSISFKTIVAFLNKVRGS